MSLPSVHTAVRPSLLAILLFLLGGRLCLAQEAEIDLFPRVMLSVSGGIFRPALDELQTNHRKGAMYGAQLGVRFFRTLPRHRLYGTAQLYRFNATRLGPGHGAGAEAGGSLKWDMTVANAGVRYGINLFKVNDISWLGGGISSITLNRNVISSAIERIGPLDFEEVRTVTTSTFESVSFYVEVGQMVQSFEFKAKPRIGLFWNAKYDHGLSHTLNISGLSIQVGFLVGV